MGYRVFIPTAGTGSRLGKITENLNKSLVSVANRPVLSHLIEKFPLDCDFVIALGHKGELVREFLKLAYPERKFNFVQIKPFKGLKSGLGHTLLTCKKYLQQPFIFLSCDTMFKGSVLPPNYNWMGYANEKNLFSYRTLSISGSKVQKINEKLISNSYLKAYIGLAGIKDYNIFWQAMHNEKKIAIKQGEVCGFRAILKKKLIIAKKFKWNDTGTLTSLNHTREAYQKANQLNILEKENEAIWFVGDNVIKFSTDKKFIKNRVHRSKILSNFVPEITFHSSNMYSYKKAKGDILSDVITQALFDRLLEHSKFFWRRSILNQKKKNIFIRNCRYFYKEKTKHRINLFYKKFNKRDKKEIINGVMTPKLSYLLKKIDWKYISNGLPGQFHGDFHFENILWNRKKKKFIFLDWRQDFAGDIQIGDIYYDLAKLLHGMIVSHELISKNKFSINWFEEKIDFNLERKKILVKCEKFFFKWCLKNRYDLKKIKIITAIIFLNISSLHHYPYSTLLYALGKKMLTEELKNK